MNFLYIRTALCVAAVLCATTESRAANVITDWNSIASSTIVANGGKPPPTSNVWFAYTSIAVYDAVNAVHHRFQPFYYTGAAPAGTSDEAAAIAAAHRILVKYFPAQRSTLDDQFNTSLGKITAAADAKTAGINVGEAAADALIAARAGDGLEASVPYTPGSGPGVWLPTPPKFAPALTPWLGQMRPFTMTSAAQFLPGGPSALTGDEWVHDYDQTRMLGGANSSVRTPQQTEIALFWTDHPGRQYAGAFGYLADNKKLDVMDSARLMAILWTGSADAAIGCFNAKYHYNFWRPVTAIPAGGANTRLAADPQWTPLGTTPPHPEYPAAHACVTAAVSDLIERYFGTPKVHFVVDSHAFGETVHTHTFEDTNALYDEVSWARIYAGFHYNHSLQDGATLGKRVSEQLFTKHFQPQP